MSLDSEYTPAASNQQRPRELTLADVEAGNHLKMQIQSGSNRLGTSPDEYCRVAVEYDWNLAAMHRDFNEHYERYESKAESAPRPNSGCWCAPGHAGPARYPCSALRCMIGFLRSGGISHYRPCPTAGCGKILFIESMAATNRYQPVNCAACGVEACVRCGSVEDHTPATCDVVRQWTELQTTDTETVNAAHNFCALNGGRWVHMCQVNNAELVDGLGFVPPDIESLKWRTKHMLTSSQLEEFRSSLGKLVESFDDHTITEGYVAFQHLGRALKWAYVAANSVGDADTAVVLHDHIQASEQLQFLLSTAFHTGAWDTPYFATLTDEASRATRSLRRIL